MSTESNAEYRTLADHPGYRFGSDGSVWSCRTKCTGKLRDKWIRLRCENMKSGHIRVTISLNKRLIRRFVHNLVLEAFVGPPPEGMECCHNDGNPSNNSIENLRWDTHISNMADRVTHGTLANGEKNGNRKLSEEDVRSIRMSSQSKSSLARTYNVTVDAIRHVISRKTWKHIA